MNERNLAPFELWPNTTDFLYVRLLGDYTTKYDGDGEHVHRYGRLLWKREAALESWALKIERHLDEVRSVWTFVNNHFEGYAPETCQRLAARLGYRAGAAVRLETASAAPGQLDLFSRERHAERRTSTPIAALRFDAQIDVRRCPKNPGMEQRFRQFRPSHPAAAPSRSAPRRAAASASPEPFSV